jgi:hypothetical protein
VCVSANTTTSRLSLSLSRAVPSCQAPIEHMLLWNEKALARQEENIRSNRNQFSFVDSNKQVRGRAARATQSAACTRFCDG